MLRLEQVPPCPPLPRAATQAWSLPWVWPGALHSPPQAGTQKTLAVPPFQTALAQGCAFTSLAGTGQAGELPATLPAPSSREVCTAKVCFIGVTPE